MNSSYQGRHPPSHLTAMATRAQLPNVEQSNEHPWYADSGANNHVIAALENLQLQESFKGEEKVVVGNGSSLPIAHTGSSLLYNSQFPFKLKHILHCPTTIANLLSIQKFCVDNKC
jgi:hypothetical protein